MKPVLLALAVLATLTGCKTNLGLPDLTMPKWEAPAEPAIKP